MQFHVLYHNVKAGNHLSGTGRKAQRGTPLRRVEHLPVQKGTRVMHGGLPALARLIAASVFFYKKMYEKKTPPSELFRLGSVLQKRYLLRLSVPVMIKMLFLKVNFNVPS